ncbi:MAG: cupredoxin domain-containing protein [Betaproteobacteria bacterium]|nr:cupredoxin domain-containing protein [Betaproteobacteria bacterium]
MKNFENRLTGSIGLGLLVSGWLVATAAQAADAEYQLVIQDHRFVPAELTVPSGKKIKLNIENRDATPEEFESHALNREKVIAGKSAGVIFIGPLTPGRYPFYGEFNQKTAQGVIVAK